MQPSFLWLHKKSNLTPQHLQHSAATAPTSPLTPRRGDGLTQAASRSHQLVSCETHQDTLFSALPSIWATGCATETVKLLSALGEEKKGGSQFIPLNLTPSQTCCWEQWLHNFSGHRNKGEKHGKILRAGSVPRGRYSPTAPRIQLSDKRSRTFT